MSDSTEDYFDFDEGDTVRVRVRDDDDNLVVDFTGVCAHFEHYPGSHPTAVFELPQTPRGGLGQVGYDAISADFEVLDS